MQNRKLQLNPQNFIAMLIIFILPILARSAESAEIKINGPRLLGINQAAQLDVALIPGDEIINAIEGKIVFDSDILALQEIRDGESFVSLWIERPNLNVLKCSEFCELNFSGIVPGGYRGDKGLIFRMIFNVKAEGTGKVELKDTRALRHDGQGTPATLAPVPLEFTAKKGVVNPPVETIEDNEAPETFLPVVDQDRELFDNKYFIIFVTQDKKSGIDHYEIHENTQKVDVRQIETKDWKIAESPYLLRDQSLGSYIYVKAVDRAGNERIEIVLPQVKPFYVNLVFWVIIIIGIAIYKFRHLIWGRLRRKQHTEKRN